MTSFKNQPQRSLMKLLKLMSNPIRLSIFQLLMTGAHCNCEVAEQLDLSLSLVSHHLHLMVESGLVKAQRDSDDARWIHYFIDPEVLEGYRRQVNALFDPEKIQTREISCVKKSCQSIKMNSKMESAKT